MTRKPRRPPTGTQLTRMGTDLAGGLAALNNNPAIRAALIARITKAAEKTPVIVLHQIAQMMELGIETDGPANR